MVLKPWDLSVASTKQKGDDYRPLTFINITVKAVILPNKNDSRLKWRGTFLTEQIGSSLVLY